MNAHAKANGILIVLPNFAIVRPLSEQKMLKVHLSTHCYLLQTVLNFYKNERFCFLRKVPKPTNCNVNVKVSLEVYTVSYIFLFSESGCIWLCS